MSEMRKHECAVVKRIQQARLSVCGLVWDLVLYLGAVQMDDRNRGVYLLRLVDGNCT